MYIGTGTAYSGLYGNDERMTMTRKDYAMVAVAFNKAFAALDPQDDTYMARYATLRDLRDDIAAAFRADRDEFDPTKFLLACHE